MKIKFRKILIVILATLTIMPNLVFADVAEGDSIVSLGANLTEDQKQQMLKEFGADENSTVIEVTNDEERKYLDGIVPIGKIGNKAISCSMITYIKEGEGLDVDVSKNINYITEDTYRNALVTAGVTDADVKVSAPVSVTGTAALTGIMKAYETSTGKKIDDNVKKAANQEMIVASSLEDDLGEKDTNNLINAIKVQVAQNMPKDDQGLRMMINNISNEYNININDAQTEQLVGLFNNMKNANVDWDKIAKEASKYSDVAKEYSKKAADYLSSEEGQQTLEKSKGWFAKFIDWIKDLFA